MGIEMAIIAGVMGAGGALLDTMQQQEQAEAEQDFLENQAAFARQQAEEEYQRAERIAESQEIQTIEEARRARLRDKKALERQRAFQAGSGISQTEGSPLKIDEMNLITSALNMNDIFDAGLAQGAETRYAGAQARRGLLFEADQYDYQRKLSKRKAKAQLTTGLFKTATAGLGGFMGAGGSFGGTGGSKMATSANAGMLNYRG